VRMTGRCDRVTINVPKRYEPKLESIHSSESYEITVSSS
jgi:hypothetical protein